MNSFASASRRGSHPGRTRMMLAGLFFLASSLTFLVAGAQTPAGPAASSVDEYLSITAIPLYTAAPPGDPSADPATAPFLSIFPPIGVPNGTAVIIAPGGAYMGLASNHEGRQVADWYAQRGVLAFVLKYRLGPTHLYPQPLLDAQRAIRLVRARASEFHVQPDRIGFMGFSAGGHLAAETGTEFDSGDGSSSNPIDRASSRPDFLVLGYPWLNAMQPNNSGLITYCSVMAISDAALCKRYADAYTPESHVSAKTPPVFLFHTTTDQTVPVASIISFYSALLRMNVPVEMHIFGLGAHGVGLGGADPQLNLWPLLLEGWLRGRGLLTPAAKAPAN